MANIYELLERINSAIYGEDVRGSIHDAIEQCYEDATGNSNSLSSVVNLLRGSGKVEKGINSVESLEGTPTVTLVEPDVVTQIDSIFLKPGVYIVVYCAIPNNFNTDGYRLITFRDDDTIDGGSTTGYKNSADVVCEPTLEGELSLIGCKIVTIQENDPELISSGEHEGTKPFWLFMIQNSGTNLSFGANISALRLSNFDPSTEDETISDVLTDLAADVAAVGDELNDVKQDLLQVYVEGTSLIINGGIPNGEDVSY